MKRFVLVGIYSLAALYVGKSIDAYHRARNGRCSLCGAEFVRDSPDETLCPLHRACYCHDLWGLDNDNGQCLCHHCWVVQKPATPFDVLPAFEDE